ncbi:hypothetical protein PPRY_a2907 [Pseudoalteromonas prydzensis ACAM 620]|nr:hypothetical protein [Pseudoalteromonas prydzensis ACAM 620]
MQSEKAALLFSRQFVIFYCNWSLTQSQKSVFAQKIATFKDSC